MVEARRRGEGDPCLAEIVARTEQTPGDAGRGIEQIPISEATLRCRDRGSLGMAVCAGDEHSLALSQSSMACRCVSCVSQTDTTVMSTSATM